MATAYGIDLGTTYSAIAKLGMTGAPEIIPDMEMGSDTLASAVYFMEDGEVMVGDTAKEEGVTAPERLHQFFKRWIGRGTDPNREHYYVDGEEKDPIELSAIVLGRIIKYAKESGENVEDVVITCPAYFDYAQRDATKQAGTAAGLNVMAVINEPTAAAINYCVNRFNEDQTVLVYDLGGGTFDVTLMRMTQQEGAGRNVEVLGTDGDAFLGGCDWDKELYQILLSKYEEQYGTSVDEIPDELKALIRGKVEQVKIKLTNKDSVKTKFNYEGESIALTVTREEFEDATLGYMEQTVGWIDSVLSKAGKTDDDVDVVLMVGGSTKMPMIRNMLTQRFGEKAFFGDPDKAVAKGAAIIADMHKKNEDVEFLRKFQEMVEKIGFKPAIGSDGKIDLSGLADENGSVPGFDGLTGSDVMEGFGGISVDELEDKLQNALTGVTVPEQNDPAYDADPTDILTAVINKKAAEAEGGTITVMDVAPRTFGLIAGSYDAQGRLCYIVDNIVHKDEQVPCAYSRTYYTPENNTQSIRLPVVESISENEVDPLERDPVTREFIFPDSSLDMKRRQELVLNIPVMLPADSEILVEFSLDNLGNVYLKATEPTSGVTQDIKFSFNETDDAMLKQIAENQKKRVYAID